MRQAKKRSRRKRSRAALPVLGAAGVSLTMAGGASANAPAVEVPPQDSGPRILLAEEEIFDVSLATFYVFDKEAEFGPSVRLAAGRGGCGGCHAGGGCGGCHAAAMGCARGALGVGAGHPGGWGGCGGGCRGGGCRGCRGCGGCGCGLGLWIGGCAGCGGGCGSCLIWDEPLLNLMAAAGVQRPYQDHCCPAGPLKYPTDSCARLPLRANMIPWGSLHWMILLPPGS